MKIAYIMSRFPLLSETFILREMIEVERLGHMVFLYPLICQDQTIIHKEAKKWIDRAICIPYLSFSIIKENFLVFFSSPTKYISILVKIIWDNRSSLDFLTKGIILFAKTVFTAKHMNKNGIEHIHAHYATHPALAAWIIHQLTGLPYSITIHSHDIYDCHAMLETKLRDAKFLAPISNYNIIYLKGLLGDWVAEKSHVVHCGINPNNYHATSRKNSSQREIFHIIQIGSLHWKKGQIHLIEAMALLRNEKIPFTLQIIGEGSERQNIEKAIAKYHLESYVTLLGAKTEEEVAGLLSDADCYIQSSVSEGIPVSLMEAMACELPVISTNITGIPELVLHNKTGLLVESKDAQGMAIALKKLYEDSDTRNEMGALGRSWVIQEFTLEQNVKKLSNLFNNI